MARRPLNPALDAQLQIRLPQALKDRLEAEADARVLSVSLLVTKLLEESLDHLVPVGELTRWPDVRMATGERVPMPRSSRDCPHGVRPTARCYACERGIGDQERAAPSG